MSPTAERDLTGPISRELYETFRRFGADAGVLSIIGSWRDTQSDEWVLESLEWWNRRKLPFRERLHYAWRVLRQNPRRVHPADPHIRAALERMARKSDGKATEASGFHVDPNEKGMGGTQR